MAIQNQNPNSLANLALGAPHRFNSATASAAGRKGSAAKKKAYQRKKSMAALAKAISEADIKSDDIKKDLQDIGVPDEDLKNNAMIVAGVFQGAVQGNLSAVEKWEQMLEKAEQEAGNNADGTEKEFLLPAKLLAKSFVDINRHVETNREYIIEGGRGSTKSSWISLKIIEMMRNDKDLNVCCVRKIGQTLRDSVFDQIKWAISVLGLDDEYKATVSPMQIRDLKTDQRIYFRGLDDPKKIKSIKPKHGYIGVLWIEEADQLNGPEELRNVAQSVLRGGDGLTFLSYNPPKSKMAWVNKYILDRNPENTTIHYSTYLDVPPEWLGRKFIDDAEHLREVNPAAYEHEYLGKAIGDGANVFDNIEVRPITDEEIASFDHIYQGVDWGYSPDPFVFIRLHYDHHRETIYFLDEIYVHKRSNAETADMIKQRGYTDTYITCDSAEPKSVQDFRNSGLPAQAAVKGPDSVRYGIKWLAGRKLVIDPKRTPNVLREFTSYEHERDKDGNPISGYPDKDNHTIDATRYSTERVWRMSYSKA